MSDSASPIQQLSTALCPWLHESLLRLEAARSSERLGHAWLITGPAGIGKLNLALAFANRLLGGGPEGALPPLGPDDAAPAMRARHVPADHHPDLHWLFPEEDKRTISVEQVRAVTQSLGLKGFRGRAKVVVIEPAEAMTSAAANALLKTLEEPTAETYLLLVSHQPDRLPSTIRSRCHVLAVPRPAAERVAAWLGIDGPGEAAVVLLAGGAPLRALELMGDSSVSFISELEDKLYDVSSNRLDAQALADEWMKQDPALALQWLIRRLQQSIRARLVPAGSNAVTDPGANPLHNAWQFLPLAALYERLDTAERLLDQLGSGINAELALRALLLKFQPTRGQS